MKNKSLLWVAIGVVVLGFALTGVMENRYYYKAGYIVLQFVVLATAWNILGGYTGYVNFGSGAFFGIGAYTAVALIQAFKLPLLFLLISGGFVAALLGLGIGYLTLRLKGIFFSIATLALAVVLEMLVVNWEFVGGGAGIPIVHPREPLFFSNYDEFLFVVMLVLAVAALAIARFIENSRIGRGLAAIRDSEEAAECMGVPTLKLKLFAATVCGFLMGVAGAPFPYYVTYVEPSSAFDLNYAVNSLAMPMIGGTTTWIGPLVGAVLLATAQQWATVTVSSEMNLLIVGVLLVGFVVFAPEGIVGLFQKLWKRKAA